MCVCVCVFTRNVKALAVVPTCIEVPVRFALANLLTASTACSYDFNPFDVAYLYSSDHILYLIDSQFDSLYHC